MLKYRLLINFELDVLVIYFQDQMSEQLKLKISREMKSLIIEKRAITIVQEIFSIFENGVSAIFDNHFYKLTQIKDSIENFEYKL